MPFVQFPLRQLLLSAQGAPAGPLQSVASQNPLAQFAVPPAHFSPFVILHDAVPSQTFPMGQALSDWYNGAFVHVPSLPGTLHALHVVVQAVSQQIPSTQLPLAH